MILAKNTDFIYCAKKRLKTVKSKQKQRKIVKNRSSLVPHLYPKALNLLITK